MAGVNRYTTPREGIVIDSLSVEDYTRAGLIRADNTGRLAKFASQDITYDVDAKDAERIGNEVGQLKEGLDKIGSDITNNNITDSTYDMVLGLKRNKNKLFGEHGTVTKAQTNLQKKLLWQQQVNELSVQNKWIDSRTKAVLRRGEEAFTGTFNKDGTTNDFIGEYGPGNIDIAARMAEVYGEASKHFTEEELSGVQNGEYKIDYKGGIDGFVLTNAQTGEVAKNLNQLTAGYNTLVAEMGNENTLLGSNVKYFGMDKGTNKGKLQEYFKSGMEMYTDTKITNAQTSSNFYADPEVKNDIAKAKIAQANKGNIGSIGIGKLGESTIIPIGNDAEVTATKSSMDTYNASVGTYTRYDSDGVEITENSRAGAKAAGSIPVSGAKALFTKIKGYDKTNINLKPIPIYYSHSEELAETALDDVYTSDKISYLENAGITVPHREAFYREGVILDVDGNPLKTIDHDKVQAFLSTVEDAFFTPDTVAIERKFDESNFDKNVNMGDGFVDNKTAAKVNKEEYNQLLHKVKAQNHKIYDVNGNELENEEKIAAIKRLENARIASNNKDFRVVGELVKDGRYTVNSKNEYQEGMLGASRLTDGNNIYYIEPSNEMRLQNKGQSNRERELMSLNSVNGKQVLIRIDNLESDRPTNIAEDFKYTHANVVKASGGDEDRAKANNEEFSGYVALFYRDGKIVRQNLPGASLRTNALNGSKVSIRDERSPQYVKGYLNNSSESKSVEQN